MTKISQTHFEQPFFSICVPQHNRTAFLIEACKTLARQTFKNFEVCISDDCSTDGMEQDLLSFLEESGLSFVYRRQEQNRRYDGNLRASIALSKGQYCFLLGNDDCFASPNTLQEIYDELQEFGSVGVALTNYEGFATARKFRRARSVGPIGRGPRIAADHYRNFSFVSGIILDGPKARALATDKWDGSEMYQMYLACRIIAAGGTLLGIDRIAIRKDIQIPHEQVDSYAMKPRLKPCPIIERRHTFDALGRLVVDAIEPYLEPSEKQSIAERVLSQLLVFTYPFWILEFRRVQSWNYAAGICLGMRPRNVTRGIKLSWPRRLRIAWLYSVVSVMGLFTPISLFDHLYPQLHSFAKSRGAVKLATFVSR